MRKAIPLCIFILLAGAISAQRAFGGHTHPHYYRNGSQHQHLVYESNCFSAYGNESGGSGGPTLELGYSTTLLNIHDQFYFMIDGCCRINGIKNVTSGAGGTVSLEMRMYNTRRKYAHYGFDVAYGVNAMAYVWGSDHSSGDDLAGIVYGMNWARIGYLNNGKFLHTNQNYFMEFQYWNGNLFTCVGMDFETFNVAGKGVRKKRVRF